MVLQIINQMSNNTMGESPDFDECGMYRDEDGEEATSEHEAEGTGSMEAAIIGVETEGLELRVKPVEEVRVRGANEEWAEEKLAELENQVRSLQLERDKLKSVLTDRDQALESVNQENKTLAKENKFFSDQLDKYEI